jgi:hypothetical protein
MHVRATLSVCIVVIGVLLATPILSSRVATHESQSQNPSTTTADVVDAGVGYVAKYEQQLTSILAMEVSTQRVVRREPADADAPRTRALNSEMFFMFSPAEHEWMAVRDVHEVDGKAIANPPDLKKALATSPLAQIARSLKSYNSRYNIGTIVRNFAEPTFSLAALDANHRANFGFAADYTERKSGVTLVTVYFHERGNATLIRNTNGSPVQSEGEFVIEAGTGRIRHAVFKVKMGSVMAELTTTYQPDDKLNMWIPSTFTEQYDEDSKNSSSTAQTERRIESIRCEAKYSNFRRFEAAGQIK